MSRIAQQWSGIIRAAMFVLSGILIGCGGLLYSQVRVAQVMRAEVDSTFFLFRQIGYATFFLQPNENQIALALAEVDGAYLEHSLRVGLTLCVFGGLILFSAPFVGRSRNRRSCSDRRASRGRLPPATRSRGSRP